MIEIVLNELSWEDLTSSIHHLKEVYSNFFAIADAVQALKIAPVRILTLSSISGTSLSAMHFLTIKDWISTLEQDRRARYLAYLSQYNFIPNNPYYMYLDKNVIGFGYALENYLGTISFYSKEKWDQSSYVIAKDYLPDGDSEVIREELEVNHYVISNEGKINHQSWTKEQYRISQISAIENITTIEKFWKDKSLLFPHLKFSNDVLDQLNLFGTVTDERFIVSIKCLQQIDEHCSNVNGKTVKLDNLPVKSSHESEATLNKYGKLREFNDADGNRHQYSLHLKPGRIRIYVRLLHESNNIEIAYIGKHLKTVKFSH